MDAADFRMPDELDRLLSLTSTNMRLASQSMRRARERLEAIDEGLIELRALVQAGNTAEALALIAAMIGEPS